MKRFIIIAPVILLVLASCAKVTPVEPLDQEITFSVANLAQATKVSEFNQQETFGTFAYWTPTNWATDKTSNLFMNNEEISYRNSAWAPAAPHYWTKSGKISFASYTPYYKASGSGGDNTTVTDTKGFSATPVYTYEGGFKIDNYTVGTANVDLMIADDSNNKDLTMNENKYYTSGVPTLFQHILARLNFVFQQKQWTGMTSVKEDESFITVTDVQLVDLYCQDSYYGHNWSYAQTANSPKMGYSLTPADTLVIAKKPASGNSQNPTSLGVSKIVMPQVLRSSDEQTVTLGPQKLIVTYNITTRFTSTAKKYYQPGLTAEVFLGNGGLDSWLPNQDITYIITISPYTDDPITFDPAVEDWTAVTNAELAVE